MSKMPAGRVPESLVSDDRGMTNLGPDCAGVGAVRVAVGKDTRVTASCPTGPIVCAAVADGVMTVRDCSVEIVVPVGAGDDIVVGDGCLVGTRV